MDCPDKSPFAEAPFDVAFVVVTMAAPELSGDAIKRATLN